MDDVPGVMERCEFTLTEGHRGEFWMRDDCNILEQEVAAAIIAAARAGLEAELVALREDIARYVARDTERLAEMEFLRERVRRIAAVGWYVFNDDIVAILGALDAAEQRAKDAERETTELRESFNRARADYHIEYNRACANADRVAALEETIRKLVNKEPTDFNGCPKCGRSFVGFDSLQCMEHECDDAG